MHYPAKILLFGEYGIILNSMALAIPYPRFSGQFRFCNQISDDRSKTEAKLNHELKKLLTHLKTNTAKFQFINFELFEDEINQGLYFDSSIPVGSGLGSSGALTAAIYERYLIKSNYKPEYHTIKSDLAAIESYFHGNSSGFDPLISLLKKPILKGNQNSFITDIELSDFFKTHTLFLINSHLKGNTSTLVNNFMDEYKNLTFKNNIDNEYIPIINQTIGAIKESDFGSFDILISKYSKFQLSHFDTMIPQKMKTYFEYGIDSDNFSLKLCGSGGGGYILGFTRDFLKTKSYLNLNHLDWTVV